MKKEINAMMTQTTEDFYCYMFSQSVQKIQEWYDRYETHLSSIGLLFGVIFSWYSLRRVDMFIEHMWIMIHLAFAFIGIIAINTFENKRTLGDIRGERIHFWLVLALQFTFGALFSSFFVFYFRSSSLGVSWPLIVLIIFLLVANEVFKKHYARLTVQVSILFLSLYLYFIFLLPIWAHKIGQDIFLAAGTASIAIVYLYLHILAVISGERFKKSKWSIRLAVGAIFIAINIMYFTNVIPPIPLSVTKAGAYHHIYQDQAGKYIGSPEKATWKEYLYSYSTYHRFAGEPVYVFTSIFSPTDFDMDIVHQWQYYDQTKNAWIDSTRISLKIVGGSENGYRTYSQKESVAPGMWRVSIETPEGQVIGRVRFEVIEVSTPAMVKEEKL